MIFALPFLSLSPLSISAANSFSVCQWQSTAPVFDKLPKRNQTENGKCKNYWKFQVQLSVKWASPAAKSSPKSCKANWSVLKCCSMNSSEMKWICFLDAGRRPQGAGRSGAAVAKIIKKMFAIYLAFIYTIIYILDIMTIQAVLQKIWRLFADFHKTLQHFLLIPCQC